MVWTVPSAWSPDEVVTSTKMNAEVADNLKFLYNGGVLQVVSATRTTTFSASISSAGDLSGDALTLTISPTSTASKVLVFGSLTLSSSDSGDDAHYGALFRNGSQVFGASGDAAGTRRRITSVGMADYSAGTFPILYLDSPSSTAALTYSVRIGTWTNSVTVYMNRTQVDDDASWNGRFVSSLTAMEVGG